MKLSGVHLSPFVRKVSVVMEIKGIAHEHEPVFPGGEGYPDFKSISPLGKIPVLLDGDFTLADSTAICIERVKAHPAVAAVLEKEQQAVARMQSGS